MNKQVAIGAVVVVIAGVILFSAGNGDDIEFTEEREAKVENHGEFEVTAIGEGTYTVGEPISLGFEVRLTKEYPEPNVGTKQFLVHEVTEIPESNLNPDTNVDAQVNEAQPLDGVARYTTTRYSCKEEGGASISFSPITVELDFDGVSQDLDPKIKAGSQGLIGITFDIECVEKEEDGEWVEIERPRLSIPAGQSDLGGPKPAPQPETDHLGNPLPENN